MTLPLFIKLSIGALYHGIVRSGIIVLNVIESRDHLLACRYLDHSRSWNSVRDVLILTGTERYVAR